MWSWTAEEQLPYVDKYFQGVSGFRNKAPYANATQVYQAVFAPATMRASFDAGEVLYKAPSQAYKMNAQLDFDKKGWIELGDMTRFLQGAASSNRVKACLQRMLDLGLDPFSREESFFFATSKESDPLREAISKDLQGIKFASFVAVGLGAALVYLGDEIANALEDSGYARTARFFRAL
jgi:hypothetical protein